MRAVGIKRWDAGYTTRRAHGQCVSHSLRMDQINLDGERMTQKKEAYAYLKKS